jgi:hypothetical protein
MLRNVNIAGPSSTARYDNASMNMLARLHRDSKPGHKPCAPKGFRRPRTSAAALGIGSVVLSTRAARLHFSSVDSSYAGIKLPCQ